MADLRASERADRLWKESDPHSCDYGTSFCNRRAACRKCVANEIRAAEQTVKAAGRREAFAEVLDRWDEMLVEDIADWLRARAEGVTT